MASSSKKRQTLAKINRERAVREKRALKQARKEARKQAATEAQDGNAAQVPAAASTEAFDQSSSKAGA